MQPIPINALTRIVNVTWNAKLLATADPYLVWADLSNAIAIQGPPGTRGQVSSVRLFVEKKSNGRTTYLTENLPLVEMEMRLLSAANSSERVELASPLSSPEAVMDLRQGNTKAPFDGAEPLSGDVLAVIDFGCPFAHSAFKTAGSRVRYLWDQDPDRTVRPVRPEGAGHQILQSDFVGQAPPVEFPVMHTFSHTHLLSSFTPPNTAEFAYWISKTLPAKYDQVTFARECQFTLIEDTAQALAVLPLSEYWSPPFVEISSGCDEHAINYGRQLVPAKIDKLFADYKGATEAEVYAAIAYYDLSNATSHGAHILSTATGWPNLAEKIGDLPSVRDKASTVDVIFVQLPATTVADTSGNSLGGYVNDALEYILARTTDDSRVVVNLSYGCYAGPHDGSSLIEKAMDAAIERGRNRGPRRGFDIVVAAGNSYQAGCHAMLKLKANRKQTLQWAIQPDDETWSFVEIWYRDSKTLKVSITPPSDTVSLGPAGIDSVCVFGEGNTPLCTIVHTENASERDGKVNRMALIAVAPTRDRDGKRATAPYGVWTIMFEAADDVTVNAWIERDDPILVQTSQRRQSVFVTKPQHDDYVDKDYIRTAVTKYDTINGIATGEFVIPVGSTIGETAVSSSFSAAAKRGDNKIVHTCPADEAEVLSGRLAFGNSGSATFRRTGTSVAAAMYSRKLLNEVPAIVITEAPNPADINRETVSSKPVPTTTTPLPRKRKPTEIEVARGIGKR
jgi:hypothetical protein